MLPAAAHAQGLKFFKNYFHTGGHFAAGVSLKGTGSGGLATGSITIPQDVTAAAGVPPDADMIAAFLYWATVTTTNGSGTVGAKFNPELFPPNTPNINSTAKLLNPSGSPPCWSAGGATGGGSNAHLVKIYRADVMPLLPLGTNGKRTGIGTHTVILPDSGSGNQVPSTAGATLVLLYRRPGQTHLMSTVIYDGGFTLNQGNAKLTQQLLGWYQTASTTTSASFTEIVANGQPNFSETVTVSDGTSSTQFSNPFVGPNWDTHSKPIALNPNKSSVTVTVERSPNSSSFDCLSFAAMLLTTTVQDSDADGIVDRLETEAESGTITDPNTGEKLPDLYSMGARTGIKDIFIEFGMMKSSIGFSNALQTVAAGHSHLPARDALDMVARAFRFAPERINVHFDLGNAYPHAATMTPAKWKACPEANATNWTTDCAIIPQFIPGTETALADGGEFIEETPCDLTKVPSCLFDAYPPPLPCTGPNGATATCQFNDFPGTVGWKSGFRAYRDEPLNFRKKNAAGTRDLGPDERGCFLAESDLASNGTFDLTTSCKRRFARVRHDLFRYVLWAHTVGLPKSDNPQSPLFHQPKNMSGIADVNGADLMVTLGLWDFATGTAFMQASTFMHELGHILGRRHGGDEGQPNCKPNYQSVMNYLFQVRGLITASGAVEIGYSNQVLKALNEETLSEAAGLTTTDNPAKAMQWRTRWYTDWDNSFIDKALTITPVTRRCNGSPLEGEIMARVDGQTIVGAIDWTANGLIDATIPDQDLNFSGSFSTLAAGSNDWANLSLRELGIRRNVGGWSADSGFWDTGFWDTGGEFGFWDTGFWDTGFWDTGFWDTGFWDSGFWDTGAENDLAVPLGEMDLDTASAVGNAPGSVSASLSGRDVLVKWTPPNVGAEKVDFYQVYRLEGTSITETNLAAKVPVGSGIVDAPGIQILDTTAKNNVTYIYIVLAQFIDPNPTDLVPPVRSGIAVTAPFSR